MYCNTGNCIAMRLASRLRNCIAGYCIVLQYMECSGFKIVLQYRSVQWKKNCIAIGNGLYCREGGLMAELYCNTIECIVNSSSNSNSQRSTVNSKFRFFFLKNKIK